MAFYVKWDDAQRESTGNDPLSKTHHPYGNVHNHLLRPAVECISIAAKNNAVHGPPHSSGIPRGACSCVISTGLRIYPVHSLSDDAIHRKQPISIHVKLWGGCAYPWSQAPEKDIILTDQNILLGVLHRLFYLLGTNLFNMRFSVGQNLNGWSRNVRL